MTWHLGAQHRTWAVILAALWLTACGSSGSKRASIELLAPEDKQELTIEDDQNPDLPGVQFEVRAQTKNIKPKTVMLLVIPGDQDTTSNALNFTEVDEDGLAIFENATLPPGAHNFTINTANSSVSSDEFSYTLKTLAIESPKDGSSVAFGNDTDKEADGLQVNVSVKAYAVDGQDDITLSVDGAQVGDPVSPNAEGEATFQNVTLATGTRILRATSGDVSSGDVKINVNESCASVTFVTPDVPADADRLTLGGGTGCPASGDDFTVDFVVSTDANEGSDAELTVNNTTKQRAKVSGALVKFEGVVLNRRMTANEVTVTVQGAGGVTCDPVPYPKDIFVDCDGSDCSIGSPVPYSGENDKGEPTFYLNKSMQIGDGFEIRVDSDSGVIGKSLQLIIDGRDGRNALSSQAVPNGNRLSATFSGVKLSNGAHTIEARCEDESGNVTESGELNWVVDTDVCGVSISDPKANALIVPGNDADSNASNGIMVPVKATISGADCTESRTAICNPTNGITDGDFSTISNDAVDTQVTLNSGADQQVCVEARDRANNIGRAAVAVKYRSVLPSVEIESPANDATFNAAGDSGHTADSDSATSACNADFRVACTELGGTVQLHRVDENGPVVGSGACEAQADGDPAIPSGFAGRAKLNKVAFLGPGSDNATIVATQTVAGASDQALVGKSEPISLTGWCQRPEVVLVPNCPPDQIELPSSGPATVDVDAVFNGPVKDRAPMTGSARVTLASDGSEVFTAPDATIDSFNYYSWSGIQLGTNPVAVNIGFTFEDDYANTTSQTCPVTLVRDLPTLTIDSPASGSKVGPGGACTPNPAAPDQYGLQLDLTLDQTAMRTLGYRVNGGSLVSVNITGTSMSLCVPVNDGANTIAVELASMVAQGGTAKPSVMVDISMLSITAPAADAALLPASDACDPGFGATFTATVSPTLNGADFSATAGVQAVTGTVSGGAINTCVPLKSGANTITVTVTRNNATLVNRSVDVAVVGGAPTHAIPITTVNVPSGGSFRTGSVTLGWATPDQDYNGQLKGYELHCSATALGANPTTQQQDDWWTNARTVTLGGSITPPATSSSASLRPGENVYCALRGRDAANQLSPITTATQVNYSFREQAINVAELNRLGYALAPVGDVNDDGVSDVLIGGTGRAWLLFGGTNVTSKTTPDVTFVGGSGIPGDEFGTRLAALGDINGDGVNDFAIAHPSLTVSAPSSAGSVGAVYVFYGRKKTDAWPTSAIDLSGSNAGACGADVCFYGQQQDEELGWAISSAGDFNADGRPDIAMSAANRDNFNGRQYVILGKAFQTASTRPTSFWNVPIRLPSGDPLGFYVDGAGFTGTDATSSELLGTAVAPAGNRDGTAGDDLLITAAGLTNGDSAKLLLLSGRANNGQSPLLKSIDPAQMTVKDTGDAFLFGIHAVSFRNWFDSGNTGVPDVAVLNGTDNYFWLYLGDNAGGSTFSNAARISFGAPNAGFGSSDLTISTGYVPSIASSLSDIDGDGIDDVCIGSTVTGSPTAVPVYVYYGADATARVNANAVAAKDATQLNPTLRSGANSRTVQPVGDITADGHPDVIIGEPNANSNQGGITILY